MKARFRLGPDKRKGDNFGQRWRRKDVKLLRRLFEATLQTEIVPVFIDLKQWTGADYESWSEWTAADVGQGWCRLYSAKSSTWTGCLLSVRKSYLWTV